MLDRLVRMMRVCMFVCCKVSCMLCLHVARAGRYVFRMLHGWDTLSMGMSGDWKIAVDNGSNMVRIGSAIFGQR